MKLKNVYVAIDLGSATIKIIVASVRKNEVLVYHKTRVRTSVLGFKNGQIINCQEVALSIKKAIDKIKKELKIDINNVSLSIPPYGLQTIICQGQSQVANTQSIISNKIYNQAYQIALNQVDPIEHKKISSYVTKAWVDGLEINPEQVINSQGKNLNLMVKVHTIPKKTYQKYKYTLELAKVNLAIVSLSPIAISNEVVLSKKNSVVIDIGHHLTYVSLFQKGILTNSFIFHLAGKHISHDINQLFKLNDYAKASVFKHKYSKIGVSNNTIIHYDSKNKGYDITYLNKIVTRKVQFLLKEIKKKIIPYFPSLIKVDFLITGGGANLTNIDKLFENVYSTSARVYSSSTIGASEADFTATLGMINLTKNYSKSHQFSTKISFDQWFSKNSKWQKFTNNFQKIFKELKNKRS